MPRGCRSPQWPPPPGPYPCLCLCRRLDYCSSPCLCSSFRFGGCFCRWPQMNFWGHPISFFYLLLLSLLLGIYQSSPLFQSRSSKNLWFLSLLATPLFTPKSSRSPRKPGGGIGPCQRSRLLGGCSGDLGSCLGRSCGSSSLPSLCSSLASSFTSVFSSLSDSGSLVGSTLTGTLAMGLLSFLSFGLLLFSSGTLFLGASFSELVDGFRRFFDFSLSFFSFLWWPDPFSWSLSLEAFSRRCSFLSLLPRALEMLGVCLPGGLSGGGGGSGACLGGKGGPGRTGVGSRGVPPNLGGVGSGLLFPETPGGGALPEVVRFPPSPRGTSPGNPIPGSGIPESLRGTQPANSRGTTYPSTMSSSSEYKSLTRSVATAMTLGSRRGSVTNPFSLASEAQKPQPQLGPWRGTIPHQLETEMLQNSAPGFVLAYGPWNI